MVQPRDPLDLPGEELHPLQPQLLLGIVHLRAHLNNQSQDPKKKDKDRKVVAALWGTEFIKFLAALAILHQEELKKEMNSSYSSNRLDSIHPILLIVLVQFILFFKLSWCKIASAARN